MTVREGGNHCNSLLHKGTEQHWAKQKQKPIPHTQQNTLSITLSCSAGWSFKDWNNICSVRRRSATRTWMGCYTIRACAFFILRVVTFCRNSKVLAIWGLPNNPERFSVTVVCSRRVVAVTSSSAINFSFCLHLHWYVYFQQEGNSSNSRNIDEALRLIPWCQIWSQKGT